MGQSMMTYRNVILVPKADKDGIKKTEMNTDAKTPNKRVHEERIIISLIPGPYGAQVVLLPKLENWGWVWETGDRRMVSHSLSEVLLEKGWIMIS